MSRAFSVTRALRRGTGVALATALSFAAPAAAASLSQVSSDPFGNSSSQHATEVEPDIFAAGSSVVSAFQVGRFFDAGATDIGFVRSTNGGSSYTGGFLPGLTVTSDPSDMSGAAFERVSDASVAFDAKHNVWLVSSIPIEPSSLLVPTVFVSRSTDGGASWLNPVSIPPPIATRINLDKNWTVCDNHSASPFYGNCYTEFDNHAEKNLEEMSTSTDGGATWSTPVATQGNDHGLGGQPLVQPNGTVIVPFESATGREAAFESTDGGASWRHAVTIANIAFHGVLGPLRTTPLPSAQIDGGGTVYVAWEDCRFRPNCGSNDIVFSSSSDGIRWSPVRRIPIDGVTSGADHFIPGLGVDTATSGSGAHLALTYYYYPDATCSGGCALDVGYISSPDGGSTWSGRSQLAGPMSMSEIANTSQGRMVGDYIATAINASGAADTVFLVGKPPTPPSVAFNEALYAPSKPLAIASASTATNVARSTGVRAASGTGNGALLKLIRAN